MVNIRQTKDKLIFSCMMEKVDLKSGEVIAEEVSISLWNRNQPRKY